MYQSAFEKIRKSIFPIFHQSVQGPLTHVGVSGTGFFIDDQGHFITAHHVISDIPPNSSLLYLGNVPDHVMPPVKIVEIYSDPARDIFLGKVESGGLAPVQLSFEKPKIGKQVCLCGYPLAQLFNDPNGSINVSNVRQYWQPTFIIDGITANNNGRIYQGFMTQDTSLNGMSGGPVFDPEGIVFGIDVAMLTREIPQKDRPSIMVHNGIVIENVTVKDVYEKIKLSPV